MDEYKTLKEIMESDEFVLGETWVLLKDGKEFKPYFINNSNNVLGLDKRGTSVYYFTATQCKIVKPVKLLWRRPVRFSSGYWRLAPDWYPTKEAFMEDWHSSCVFGKWESREEPRIVDE